MNHGSLFSEMPFYFVMNRQINVTQHGFWGHFCVFMDRQGKTRGKHGKDLGLVLCAVVDAFVFFSDRDLMCEA